MVALATAAKTEGRKTWLLPRRQRFSSWRQLWAKVKIYIV
jgi:hypothetical protein